MGHAQIVLARIDVIPADVVGEARVAAAEFRRGGGEPGQHDVEEIGAAAEHAAGRIHPNLDHAAAADQIVDGPRLDERQADLVAARRRGEGHAFDQRRVVLHVEQFSKALRRTGQALVARHVGDPVTVHEDPPVVFQAGEELFAGADRHGLSLTYLCHPGGGPLLSGIW